MELQLSYFKSWNMMLWKCCTQYASKFGKLSSGHRTGKGQLSFQSQRKAMQKNAQTAAQFHTLENYCSTFSKLGFNSTWTENFQMFNLDLEKAEEPEIKLPTSVGSYKKQEDYRKTSISALFTMSKPLTMWITINCGKFWKRGDYHLPYLPPEKPVCRSRRNTVLDREQQTDSKLGKEYIKVVSCHPDYLTYMQSTSWEASLDESQAGIKISWRNINKICRWYHPNNWK